MLSKKETPVCVMKLMYSIKYSNYSPVLIGNEHYKIQQYRSITSMYKLCIFYTTHFMLMFS